MMHHDFGVAFIPCDKDKLVFRVSTRVLRLLASTAVADSLTSLHQPDEPKHLLFFVMKSDNLITR